MMARMTAARLDIFRVLQRRAARAAIALFAALAPILAFAQDEKNYPDARLEGYKDPVFLDAGGTGGTITFFLILMLITVGVMFINAKRSHLD
jgi:hypothetical protein